MSVRVGKGIKDVGLGLRRASRMRVRAENGLKDEGTTLRYRRLRALKSGL